jgi:hypothetical protein
MNGHVTASSAKRIEGERQRLLGAWRNPKFKEAELGGAFFAPKETYKALKEGRGGGANERRAFYWRALKQALKKSWIP